jgi:predicted enzyme related to lactoylglutathione lyase
MRPAGIMIGSSQPKKLGEFYGKFLGKPGWVDDANGWYGFGDKGSSIMIGPHSDVKGNAKEPARMIIFIETKDVRKSFDTVISATKAKVVAKPYQPDAKSMPDAWLATFEDPDGNYVQLATPWAE